MYINVQHVWNNKTTATLQNWNDTRRNVFLCDTIWRNRKNIRTSTSWKDIPQISWISRRAMTPFVVLSAGIIRRYTHRVIMTRKALRHAVSTKVPTATCFHSIGWWRKKLTVMTYGMKQQLLNKNQLAERYISQVVQKFTECSCTKYKHTIEKSNHTVYQLRMLYWKFKIHLHHST